VLASSSHQQTSSTLSSKEIKHAAVWPQLGDSLGSGISGDWMQAE